MTTRFGLRESNHLRFIHLETQADLEHAVLTLVGRTRGSNRYSTRRACRRCAGASPASRALRQSSAASNCPPPAPRQSGAASPPRSIRFTTTRCGGHAPNRLGRLGLSAAKIKTLKNLAREIAAERLNLDVLANEDADAAHNTLTALPGSGPGPPTSICCSASAMATRGRPAISPFRRR